MIFCLSLPSSKVIGVSHIADLESSVFTVSILWEAEIVVCVPLRFCCPGRHISKLVDYLIMSRQGTLMLKVP